MIIVQDLLGFGQVNGDARALAPGQAEQPIEIVAHDGGFRRHRAHGAQLLQLGGRLVAGFLGKLDLLDLVFQLRQLVAAIFAFAKLFLIAFICSFR